MATTTTNLGLIKPAGTDKIRIANINQNMDTLDEKIGPVGNTSLQSQLTTHSNSLNGVESGIAIVANGNTHAAISSGDFVYVKNHGTLAEGMYIATSAIAANGTLSTSNLSSASSGGLNALRSSTNQALSKLKTAIGSVSGSTTDVFIQNAVNALNAIFPFSNLAVATTITGSVTWVDHNYYRFIATKSHNNYIEIDFASNTDHLTARAGTSDAVVTRYDELALKSEIAKQTGTATINTTNISDGTVRYRKTGNIVVVYVTNVIAKVRLNGNQVIATGLPNADASDIQVCLCNSTTHKAVRCAISTTGELKAQYDAIEIGEQICGTFSYLV